MLGDDGQRFYADPFPISHNGKLTLFFEDTSIGKAKASFQPLKSGRMVRSEFRASCWSNRAICPIHSCSSAKDRFG